MKKNNSGFTLIELLVAMGIIAVLAGMATFNFNQSRVRARDVQRKNDLSQLQKALELYRNDNMGSYPSAANFQTVLKTNQYTKVIFQDPRSQEWLGYQYLPSADLKSYYMMACLENTVDQTKTTDLAICGLFKTPPACTCGKTIGATTGVMYTISQP
jgi:prepilin-type N-terminal cleavage/methylation domain-containing protein